MNADTNNSKTPDGSTDTDDEQKARSKSLPDGSQSDGTPESDKDTASGGPADQP